LHSLIPIAKKKGFKFIQEDGRDNAYDESGNELVEMEVDSEQFPLGNITDFDTYMDLKPPERGEKAKEVKAKVVVDKSPDKRDYTRRSSEKKNNFFKIIYEKDCKVPQAPEELKIVRRTAYDWYKKDQEAAIRNQTNRGPTQQEEKKKVGRPKILNNERKQFLLQKYGEDSRATVSEAVESLTTQFMGLKIAKSAVHDFMTNECALTIKKAHFEPKERNSPDSITARFNRVTNLMTTDMDYQSNCVFIDESQHGLI
jgi:transposase